MPFSDVLHQSEAQVRLQRALRDGRLSHALLFAGADGVGKEMLAQRLAAALLCSRPRDVPPPPGATDDDGPWRDACGSCEDCILFAAGNHPDYHRVDRFLNKFHPDSKVRRSKALEFSVHVIRHFLLDCMGQRPSRGRAKVFVVVEAERLNEEAQNAMLKTLEEPPDRSHLILVTTSPDALTPTIRSRCQPVAFRSLPTSFVARVLTEQHGATPPCAAFIAEFAQGRLGPAVRFLQDGLWNRAPEVARAVEDAVSDPIGCSKTLQRIADEIAKNQEPETDEDAEVDDGEDDDASSSESSEETDVPASSSPKTAVLRRSRLDVCALVAAILRGALRTTTGGPAVASAHSRDGPHRRAAPTPRSVCEAIRAVAEAETQLERNAYVPLVFDVLGVRIGRGLSGRANPGAR